MSHLLQKLNDKQRQAVEATHGPVLVMAGAGSGKTRALTHRIAYLIEEKKISSEHILAVTFTNKAATEMKNRIAKLLQPRDDDFAGREPFAITSEDAFYRGNPNLPTVGTFHATCVRMLRKYIHLLDYENQFVIYDTADQQILMKQIMKDMNIDEKQMNPRAVLNYISNAKNELIGPEQYHQYAHNYFTQHVAEIYEVYQKNLHKNNALDFDDIIMKTVELFQKEAKVLDYFQEKFQFISVDEYQDTNHAQYVLTKLLAQKYRNLCVIGDSDQSIYSFRGANIGNILNFEKDYPDAQTILLEQNYRSTQPILDAAHHIIVKNAKRKDKKLWTEREGGEKIELATLDNEREEGEFIAREIMNRLRTYEHPDYRDFVILYRTNAQSRVLEEVFLRHGIPYKIVGGIKFYERKEIKDILAYLHIIQNPNDTVSLLRIINTPARKIGNKTIEQLQNYAIQHDLSLFGAMEQASQLGELADTKIEAIQNFVNLIRDLQKVNREFPASGVIKHVLDYSGYKAMIDDNTAEGDARVENVYELIGVASKYEKLEPGTSLSIFLEEVSLIADIDSLDNQDNAVTMMTIHSAKGLEFPIVFLVGLEEGIFPHSRSLLERDQLEEERRLMYVAMTRAKDKLYLLHARNRMLYGQTQSNAPSQFLMDIPETLIEKEQFQRSTHQKSFRRDQLAGMPIPVETASSQAEEAAHEAAQAIENFSDGDRVAHKIFGEGIVISVTGGVATVCFKDPKHGLKKLALSVAPLKKIA